MHAAFNNFHAFLRMGGYAGYVWSAYGIMALTLITYLCFAKLKLKKIIKTLWRQHEEKS